MGEPLIKRWWLWAGGVALLQAALVAGVALSDPILHEFFILPPEERGGSALGGSGEGGAAAEGGPEQAPPPEALAEALREGAMPPPLTIENRGDEMEVNAQGAPQTPDGRQPPEHNGPFNTEELARPDRQTTLDSELAYFTVFNPSVVPWKRGASRDEVHDDYSLGIRDPRAFRIEIKDGPVRADHERFWGSLLIHMRPGVRIALPSVAPQATILRYQTEPPTFLEFSKDTADNFFVQGEREGTVRLNYLMEAHTSYFGGDLDPKLKVRDLPSRNRPRLPPAVQKSADAAIEVIGVDRSASLPVQLDALVAYFRSFEARDFPADALSQDIYLDLTLNKVGVCRHRAFAFVVTAQALGIMARYVHNEAHAFVEVLIPRRGWLRIDLGGAAVDFNVHNASDKLLHSPPDVDPFTQPESFARSYSRQLGQGETEADIDDDGALDTITGVPDLAQPKLGPGDTPQANPEPGADEQVDSEVEDEALSFPTPEGLPDEPAPASPTQMPSTLVIDTDSALSNIYRGDIFKISGVLTDAQGPPLARERVEAYLVPKGRNSPEDFIPVGSGVTDASGKVQIEATVPDTLALGRWALYLYYRGSENYLNSHSQ